MKQQPFASPGEALEHHGIKGMRWGVRKEDETASRSGISQTPPGGSGKATSDSAKLTEFNDLSQKIISQSNLNPHLVQAKYGPPQLQGKIEQKQHADHERLKKAAIGAGIGVGAVAIGFAVYKLNQSPGGFPAALPTDKEKLKTLIRTNGKAYNHAVDGLAINWDKGVDLPSGSILRRLSSAAETTPRPDGFFAAHLESDVQSYKAILPTFWKDWGVGSAEKGGFLNHYKANGAVRAPSGKESFETFKKLVDTDDAFNKDFVSFWDANGLRGKSDAQLKNHFLNFSQMFAVSDDPSTKRYFSELKKRGYNSVIDFNDAGKLGKAPLRVFDGKMFDIVKNEPQSLNDFYTAAKAWSPELVHIYESMSKALTHYAVKGRIVVPRILAQNGDRRLSKKTNYNPEITHETAAIRVSG